MAGAMESTISVQGDQGLISFGAVEIWDGARLCLFRDLANHLVNVEKCLTVGIDMKHVKYVPSGFFGQLCSFQDAGVSIQLRSPQPRIKQMIWFRQFLGEGRKGCYGFLSNPNVVLHPEDEEQCSGFRVLGGCDDLKAV